MKIDDIMNLLSEYKDNPELLEEDVSECENIINDIIIAEKKYSYGLERTTSMARQAEIERIVLQGFEESKHENKEN